MSTLLLCDGAPGPVKWPEMQRVLVIGATGTVGRAVISELTAMHVPVRALSRNPGSAGLAPEVEMAAGDLTAPDTLGAALHGVESVFLVWTAPGVAAAPALDRIARSARRIVFLSAPLKTPHPFYQQPNPARTLAAHIEELIEASGLEWTLIRPAIFAANALLWWAPRIRAGECVRWPYLSVPTAPIDERDIASVSARALCEDGHGGMDYVITGPESLTQAEQISTIGQVMGRPARMEEITPEEARRELSKIFPLPAVQMLLDAWAAAAGQPAYVNTEVARITGSAARSFAEWAQTNVSAFR